MSTYTEDYVASVMDTWLIPDGYVALRQCWKDDLDQFPDSVPSRAWLSYTRQGYAFDAFFLRSANVIRSSDDLRIFEEIYGDLYTLYPTYESVRSTELRWSHLCPTGLEEDTLGALNPRMLAEARYKNKTTPIFEWVRSWKWRVGSIYRVKVSDDDLAHPPVTVVCLSADPLYLTLFGDVDRAAVQLDTKAVVRLGTVRTGKLHKIQESLGLAG